MLKITSLILGLSLYLFLGPITQVKAHLFGASLERVVDTYFIDIGHSEEQLEVGDSVRFDFNLYQADNQTEAVPFTDIWVRISQGNTSVFAGNLHTPLLGKTGMTLQFPEPGEYQLLARFHDTDQTLVETTFDISVDPAPVGPVLKLMQNPVVLGLLVVGGLAFSFGAGFMISGLFIVESETPKKTKKADVKKRN